MERQGTRVGEPACLEHRELWWWLPQPGPFAAGGTGKAQLLGLPSSLGEGEMLAAGLWGRGLLCSMLSAALVTCRQTGIALNALYPPGD